VRIGESGSINGKDRDPLHAWAMAGQFRTEADRLRPPLCSTTLSRQGMYEASARR
jgi:hypothetical protein